MRTLHFEDRGQDFTWWRIDDSNTVVEAGPFQNAFWKGLRITRPGSIAVGGRPVFRRPGYPTPRELNYRIVRIETGEAA